MARRVGYQGAAAMTICGDVLTGTEAVAAGLVWRLRRLWSRIGYRAREAVVALEREGWVTTRLHRGAFISSFDEATIRDHYELFALIYGLAIKRTIARNDSEVVGRMGAIARKVVATDDPVEVQQRGLPAIARAAKKGDGERAAAEYSRMFGQQAECVVALFRQRNLVPRSQPA
jgi:enoyl-CoA hydratase/carnithine racemase